MSVVGVCTSSVACQNNASGNIPKCDSGENGVSVDWSYNKFYNCK